MRTFWTISAASVAAILAGVAAAQDVEIIAPDEVEIVRPGEIDGTTRNVDVVQPEGVVRAEPRQVGEAPVVNADDLVELDGDFVLPTLNLPVHALDDYDLVDRDGEDVGKVEAVLGPNEGTATAVAVEFDGPGWFFDDGSVTRVVDISAFSIEGDRLIIDMLVDDRRSLPVYSD